MTTTTGLAGQGSKHGSSNGYLTPRLVAGAGLSAALITAAVIGLLTFQSPPSNQPASSVSAPAAEYTDLSRPRLLSPDELSSPATIAVAESAPIATLPAPI